MVENCVAVSHRPRDYIINFSLIINKCWGNCLGFLSNIQLNVTFGRLFGVGYAEVGVGMHIKEQPREGTVVSEIGWCLLIGVCQ